MINKDYADVVYKAQVAFYMRNGIKPTDVFLGKNDTIVFRFDRKESYPYYIQWHQNKPDKENIM